MIQHRFFESWGFHYVRATPPFSMLALVERGLGLTDSSGPGANLDLPSLFDLRAVELVHDSSDDIRRAIQRRRSLGDRTGDNPCAYVVGSLGSFGMMRMYGTVADLEGLRPEGQTFVTRSMRKAVDWLIGFLDVSAGDADTIREVIGDGLSALDFGDPAQD